MMGRQLDEGADDAEMTNSRYSCSGDVPFPAKVLTSADPANPRRAGDNGDKRE